MPLTRQLAEQALRALEKAQVRADLYAVDNAIDALRAAIVAADKYAAQNPLGGPAKVFDAMADAIRAGDGYEETLRRYGFAEMKALAEPEQKSDPGAWHGWVLREVLFDNGEPIGHREPEQEPVGWQWLDSANYRKKLPANAIREHWRPLYTAPTPRKPEQDDPSPQFAHRLAIMLECALIDPTGSWDEAHKTLDEYRAAVRKWHEAHGQPYVSAFGKD